MLLLVLFFELARPRLRRSLTRARVAIARARRAHAEGSYDPGRERRAEQRARALLRSCVNQEDWEIYSELGFLRVLGPVGAAAGEAPAPYAYLIYPHKPIVAYVPATGELLSEYCITFPDHSRPFGSSRLPHSDDVLAKWMAITADERRLIGEANMHLPGPPGRARAGPPRPRPAGTLGTRACRTRARWCASRVSANGGFDVRHRSRALTEGPERAAARAYLHGIGYSAEDLAKPIVGVAHSWIETMPCNFNNRVLAAKAKEGIRAAGGTPMELNTIAISDGITMGTAGMRASLVSRELIADSIELVASAHCFDAVLAISGCDKTIPGTVMALTRLGVPSLMLYGGSIRPGHFNGEEVTIQQVFEAVGAHAAGRITEEELHALEDAASPGAGACGGQFTANTMAMAFEVMGISPAGSAMVPAEDGRKLEVARQAGELVMDVLRRGQLPNRIITKQGLENAIAAVAMSGGSTNGVLHLLAIAREAGVPLAIDEFDDISERTPLLCDLQPGGRYAATDLYEAGGVPLVLKRMLEAGVLHGDAETVTGHTIGHHAVRGAGDPGPARRAPARGSARPHRRLRDPAREHRSGRVRRQARRPRAPLPHRPRPRVRRRGGGDGGGAREGDQGRRRGRDPRRGTGRRAGDARDARGHGGAGRRGAGGNRRPDHRRALLGRHPRLHGRPRGTRGGPRRADRRPRRRRPDHDRRRVPRRWTWRSAPTSSPGAWPRTVRPPRTPTSTSRSASTRCSWAAPPRAPSRAEAPAGAGARPTRPGSRAAGR